MIDKEVKCELLATVIAGFAAILLLFLFVVTIDTVQAQQLEATRHQRLDTTLRQMYLTRCGLELDHVMTENWTVTPDGVGTGPRLEIRSCPEFTENGDIRVTYRFIPPSQREDGTPLSLSDLAFYEVEALHTNEGGVLTIKVYDSNGIASESAQTNIEVE